MIKRLVYIFSFLLVQSAVAQEEFLYACNEAKFSIIFGGEPHIKNDEGLFDVMFEDTKLNITYIASYKKSESNLEGKEYCAELLKELKNNEEIHVNFSKIIDFKGFVALKTETAFENKYNLFTYETIAFKYNGYDIELIAMNKEEDLDLRDINKFANSFKVIE